MCRRYWASAGPQEAHYIPGPLLRDGKNELVVLEVEATPPETKSERDPLFS
jgi:hypothetical protein